MNIKALPDHSKIWVFLSNRRFTADELSWLNQILTNITQNWKAHGTPLKAGYSLEFDQLIVLAVDESHEPASGCSIDSVVHEIQAIERALNLNLFNRTDVPLLETEGLELLSRLELKERILKGTLTESASVIDLTLTNLGDWRKAKMKSLGESWAARWIPKLQS